MKILIVGLGVIGTTYVYLFEKAVIRRISKCLILT